MRTGLMMVIALAVALFAVVPAVAIPSIERDLASRSAAMLRAQGHDWATVAAEGLSVQIGGEAPTAAVHDQALQAVAALDGVGAVVDQTTLAPRRTYDLQAVRTPEALAVTGTVPDQETADAVLAAIAAVDPALAVESALAVVPGEARAGWSEAAAAAGERAALLFEGTVVLSDEALAITGSVLDEGALAALQSAPAGAGDIPVTVDASVSVPRLYGLRLTRTPRLLVLAGEAPSSFSRDALIALAERQGVPRVDAEQLTVEIGIATEEWHRMASALIRHVGAMPQAEAQLEPGRLTISGVVADPAMADLTRTALDAVFGNQAGLELMIDIRPSGGADLPPPDEAPVIEDPAALLAWADSAPRPDVTSLPTLSANDCQAALNELAVNDRIAFVQEGAELDPAGRTLLEAIAMTIRRCPDAQIEVSGHTETSDDPAASEALSAARADAVVDYLTRRGVDATRLVAAGYGDMVPIADNATEEGRERNRRIEFLVVPSQ